MSAPPSGEGSFCTQGTLGVCPCRPHRVCSRQPQWTAEPAAQFFSGCAYACPPRCHPRGASFLHLVCPSGALRYCPFKPERPAGSRFILAQRPHAPTPVFSACGAESRGLCQVFGEGGLSGPFPLRVEARSPGTVALLVPLSESPSSRSSSTT